MDATFILPYSNKITVYSKTGCNNCDKVKMLLEDFVESENKNENENEGIILTTNDFTIVNCDKLLENNKELFIFNVEQIIGKMPWQFPLVFANGKLIGGFKETVRYFDKITLDKAFEQNKDF